MLARTVYGDNILIPYAELREYYLPNRFDTYSSVVFYGSLLYNKVNVFSEWSAYHEVMPRVYLGRIPENNVLPQHVKLVISVVTSSELAAVNFDIKALENKGIEHILVSMPDFTAKVSNHAVIRAIRAIEELDYGYTYVHCKAGRARSAMFVVIYMAYQALKNIEEVTDELLEKAINAAQQRLKDIREQVDISEEKLLKAKQILRELPMIKCKDTPQIPITDLHSFRYLSRGHFLSSLEFKNVLCQFSSFKSLIIYMLNLSEGSHRAQRLQAFMEQIYEVKTELQAEKWYASLRMRRSALDEFLQAQPQISQDDKPVREKLYNNFSQQLDCYLRDKLPDNMFNEPLYMGDYELNRHARLISFADNFLTVNHDYDGLLEYYYFNTCFQRSPGETRANLRWHTDYYNPHPNSECERFEQCHHFDRMNMTLRNNLLLSRLFITNAIKMNLAEQFTGLSKIRVLDVGCGFSGSLAGLLAYLGEARVEYLGIDVNQQCIRANKEAYSRFPHCQFMKEGALNLLSQAEHQNQYDLVLIQHPNFEDEPNQAVFSKIFSEVSKLMAENAILYATFYTSEEASYFQKYVQEMVNKSLGFCTLSPTFTCDAEKQFTDEEGKQFIPENFVMISPPYHPLTQTLSIL